jgi:hypothetical protein
MLLLLLLPGPHALDVCVHVSLDWQCEARWQHHQLRGLPTAWPAEGQVAAQPACAVVCSSNRQGALQLSWQAQSKSRHMLKTRRYPAPGPEPAGWGGLSCCTRLAAAIRRCNKQRPELLLEVVVQADARPVALVGRHSMQGLQQEQLPNGAGKLSDSAVRQTHRDAQRQIVPEQRKKQPASEAHPLHTRHVHSRHCHLAERDQLGLCDCPVRHA